MIDKSKLESSDILSYVVNPNTDFIGHAVAFFQRYSRFGYKSSHVCMVANDVDYVLEETFPKARVWKIDWDYLDKHYCIKHYRVKNSKEVITIPADLSHMHINDKLRKRLVEGFKKCGREPVGNITKQRWQHMQDFMKMLVEVEWPYDTLTIVTLGLVNGSGIHCAESIHLDFDYVMSADHRDPIPKPVEIMDRYGLIEII